MKKYIIFLLIIALCSMNASALNTTVKKTPVPVLEKFSEEFYGEVTYMDGSPVPAGNIIVTKDQYGTLMGNYTILYDGIYGSTKPREGNLVASVYLDPSNRTSRSLVTFVNFFINGARAKETVEFKQGNAIKFDIKLPIAPPTPEPTPTPTPVPTTIETTVPPTTITTIPTTPAPFNGIFSPSESDNIMLFYGIIAFGMILGGIVLITVVQLLLAAKSSRDDIIGPDEEE